MREVPHQPPLPLPKRTFFVYLCMQYADTCPNWAGKVAARTVAGSIIGCLEHPERRVFENVLTTSSRCAHGSGGLHRLEDAGETP
jgi:hypothetical protein